MSRIPTIALDELMASNSGSVDPSKFPDEAFDLYSVPAFDNGRPELFLGREIGSSKQVVQPNDVLLSRIVPHIRRAWVVGEQRGRRQIASGEWIVFRSAKTYPSYLRYLLGGDRFHAQFMNTVAGVGGSLMRARPAQVADIEVLLPSLSEQRRTAGRLEKADRLRRTRRYALELTDTFLPAAFHRFFGKANPQSAAWPSVELVELCDSEDDIRCGPFGTQLNKNEFRTFGVPLWGIKHVNAEFALKTHEFLTETKAEQLNEYSLLPGDLVMTRKGTVGNCALYPAHFPRGIMHSDLLRIRLKSGTCSPLFLTHQLHNSREIERQIEMISGGAIMAGINVGMLRSIRIQLPPLPLQENFAAVVERVERLRAVQREALRQAEHLFASLLHHAFSG